MSIGERIKYYRLKNNLTQADLADHLGITKQTVFKYENGIVTNIPSDKIEVMASIFRITPGVLFGWEESTGTVRSTPDEHLLDSFHQLNSDGQELAIDYVDALAEKPKYQRTDEDE